MDRIRSDRVLFLRKVLWFLGAERPDGIVYTASGAVAEQGVTIAADWDVLPPGTVVYIDGLGERVVQDRGGAIKGNAVDIYFEDHHEALVFGRQAVRLYIVTEVTP